MEIFLGIAVIVLLGLVIFLLLKSNNTSRVEDVVNKALPELLKTTNEQLVLMANEKLSAEKKEIRADLEGKRGEIERLVKVIQEDLKDSEKKLNKAELDRTGAYSKMTQQLEDYKKVTEQLSTSTENLRKVLSNNQLRGQFGEQVAEELLKMSGFVKGVDYEFNKEQAGSETRPDFCVFLPDGTRINVDAKFPYANLQKGVETEDKNTRDDFLKKFETDVKEKIKQVTTRDYINPEDKTVDFVILFIPNEMIFSYIYDKLNSVWTDAMQKKVILAGPFSFTALLRMIKQSYDNFRVQKNISQIVNHVRSLEKEFVKFSDEFNKVGDRIESLTKQYNDVSRTRFNQINKIMDKVKLEEGDKEDQPKLIG